jgi:hypothetical protein
MYIVKLEEGVYLAAWKGDPGRTCRRKEAMEFYSKNKAENKLKQAREYKPFKKAEILEVDG